MARHVKQFRYYNDGSQKNSSPGLNTEQFISGRVFNGYYPIVQLGIQSLPGTKFFLNDSYNPVIIGNTGIYELDIIGQTEITSLTFAAETMRAIARNDNAYLIVDIIYEKLEEEEG